MNCWLQEPSQNRLSNRYGWKATGCGALSLALLLMPGCHRSLPMHEATIEFLHVPPSQVGDSELPDRISGRVIDGASGARVVVYAHNGVWWVQPFRSRPFTTIGSDGSWSTVTHLGTEYAVLLVSPGYQPSARVTELPSVGDGVLAEATAKGSLSYKDEPKVLRFGGYEWNIRSSEGDHGGELSDYEPANAWVDDHGYLHLLMSQEEGDWHCAGVSLTRSLGYGTYRFVVQDSAQLPPSVVFTMFLRDDRLDPEDRAEMDIELGRWGKAQNRNADYVIQPYYVPENSVHFNVPSGPMTYVVRWDPGSATFRTFAGESTQGRKVMEHVFKSGVPIPAAETLHLDFYDFHHSQSGLQHPVEIVVEKFEYLP